MIITQTGYTPGDSPAGVPLIGYDNRITAISATSAASGFPASNLLNPATHLIWKATSTATQTLTINVNGTTNYLAIAKHNFFEGDIRIALSDGSSPAILASTAVDDASPIIIRFSPTSNTLSLTLVGGSSPPTGTAQAAVIYAGELLVLERSVKVDVQHANLYHARQASVLAGMSENGNFLGRVLTSEWLESRADFAWFTPDWYRTYFDPFAEAAMTEPFFWVWNPVEYPDEVAFAWITETIVPETDPATRRVAASIVMRALA